MAQISEYTTKYWKTNFGVVCMERDNYKLLEG